MPPAAVKAVKTEIHSAQIYTEPSPADPNGTVWFWRPFGARQRCESCGSAEGCGALSSGECPVQDWKDLNAVGSYCLACAARLVAESRLVAERPDRRARSMARR